MDGVQEYKVITNLAGAEYYSGMGGQTTISSKSGGNRLSGDVFEYIRNSVLDARNYFDPLPTVLGGSRIPGFKRNQFGAALGGPLKANKSFFFVNYEGLRQSTGNPLYVGVDTTMPPECWTSTSNSTSHSIQLTDNPCAAYPGGFPPIGNSNTSGPPPTWTGTVNPKMVAVANLYPYPNVTNPLTGRLTQFVYTPSQGNVEEASEDFGQIRLDENFSTKNIGFIRYTIDNARLLRPDSYPQFKDTDLSQSQFLTLAETHDFSSALVNSTRLSFARTNLSTITLPSSSTAASQIEAPGLTSFISNPGDKSGDCPGGNCMIGLIVGTGLTTMGPSTVAPGYLIQNLVSLGDDLFWTKGKHAFKLGFLINHFDDPMYNDLIFGSVNVMPDVFPGVTGDRLGDSILQGYALAQSFEQQSPVADTRRDWDFWTIGGYLQDDYRTTSRFTLNLGIRYELETVPSDRSGKNWGYSNLATGNLNCSATNNPATCVTQHGPIWLNPTLKNFSPRVGFAWNPLGNGKTSIRGGYGVYYDLSNMGNKLGQQSNQVPPLSNIENVFENYSSVFGGFPFWPFEIPHNVNAPTCSAATSGAPPNGGFFGMPDSVLNSLSCLTPQLAGNVYRPKNTYMQQYNLSIQQQLPDRTALSVAYVGSRGIHIRRVEEGNPVEPCNMPNSTTAGLSGCTTAEADGQIPAQLAWNKGMTPVWNPGLNPSNAYLGNTYRLNPNLPALVENQSDGDSYYNAIQTSVAKQMAQGLQFQVAFTWSKLVDTTQGDIASMDEGSNLPMNPFNSRADRGPTAFDSKANLRANMVYHLPGPRESGFLPTLVKGWTMSNIVSFQTGYPYECMVQFGQNTSNAELGIEDVGGNLSNNRCDMVTASNLADAEELDPQATVYNKSTVIQHKASQWFNPHMFTLPHPQDFTTYKAGNNATGYMGDSPRGLMRGPGQSDWDISMVKSTRLVWLGEKGNFEFRAEVFNVLNHTNFAFPYSNNYNANFEAIQAYNSGSGNDITPNAGLITNTLINSRQIQFAAKFEF
jgi:hypothetical protein